jgi:hypothetical protein
MKDAEAGSKGIAPCANAILSTRVAVLATATKIPATPLAGREALIVTNEGSATVYLGGATVTAGAAGTGYPLVAGASLPVELGPDVDLYGIEAGGAGVVKVLEVS